MAPPFKLTPDLHARIVSYVRAGNFRSTAAAAAGISPVTLRDWLRRGARGEQPFQQFREDVDQAEAQAEARDAALISKAAEHDWKAAAWRLERRAHRRWGRKDQLDMKQTVVSKQDPSPASAAEIMRRRFGAVTPAAEQDGSSPPDAPDGTPKR